MKTRLTGLMACLLLSMPTANAVGRFAEIDAVMDNSLSEQQTEKEYQDFVFAYMAEYEHWRVEYLKDFDKYRAEIIQKWGVGDVSQPHKNVEYSADQNLKSVIDYDKGELTVSVLVDNNLSDQAAKAEVTKQVEQLVAKGDSTAAKALSSAQPQTQAQIKVIEVEFSAANEKQAKQVIIAQTKAQLTEIDKESDKAQLTKNDSLSVDLIEQVSIQKKKKLLAGAKQRLESVAEDYEQHRQQEKAQLTEKKIVEYKVALAKNGLSSRANAVVDFAQTEGDRWQVSSALIMAVIHSESSFDPKATSPIPAYGLMQIVPTTAGYDVNQIVRKKSEPMSSGELYTPNINVETGAAYLNILNKRYLKSIENDESRLYCVIAAYNTGAGNVARAFNADGARNIRKASKVINKMSPDEVYQHLLTNLPYDETKHYLKKVSSRIELYQNRL
ncbi:transglycosylase SLT domain-containing protein [Shewanella pneumatophori]|uniref:Transglycosylase SLT domain-containing protein n=1 Tax=Shewanella pneumatophori TaxID=314092 RepID=A0A9X1ZFS3_9GAMM|nr:transglycosylase SLT domain-containing protein [Shewanella pneumatophori]MCL1140741.1 transglycosylase SLT domain-containing protein [Shewanella pneumatophori]